MSRASRKTHNGPGVTGALNWRGSISQSVGFSSYLPGADVVTLKDFGFGLIANGVIGIVAAVIIIALPVLASRLF
jgi:hypothetical protein